MTNVLFCFFCSMHERGRTPSCVIRIALEEGKKRLKYSGSHHNLILISLAMDSPQHHAGDV